MMYGGTLSPYSRNGGGSTWLPCVILFYLWWSRSNRFLWSGGSGSTWDLFCPVMDVITLSFMSLWQALKAGVLMSKGRHEEALPLLERGWSILSHPRHSMWAVVSQTLADCYEKLGRMDEAFAIDKEVRPS